MRRIITAILLFLLSVVSKIPSRGVTHSIIIRTPCCSHYTLPTQSITCRVGVPNGTTNPESLALTNPNIGFKSALNPVLVFISISGRTVYPSLGLYVDTQYLTILNDQITNITCVSGFISESRVRNKHAI